MKHILFIFVLFSSSGIACIPPRGFDIFEVGRSADLVFIGKFVGYESLDKKTLVDGLAKVEILKFWKGKSEREYFYIEDYNPNNDNCLSSFNPSIHEIGSEFLFAISEFQTDRKGFVFFCRKLSFD